MSASATSKRETTPKQIDQALAELRGNATQFARLSPSAKASLARETIVTVARQAQRWVDEGSRARGLTGHLKAEEWLGGPITTIRMLRLIAESLDEISRTGKPSFGKGSSVRTDGHLQVEVMPSSKLDQVMYGGFTSYMLMEEGLTKQTAREKQASFYSKADPEGELCLVLGAGNVSSIGPMDAFTKMFHDGAVCLLKMNPVNEWSGPILEDALKPMIDKGYLRIVYGGVEVGKYTSSHDGIDSIHITGSDRTHDAIVWGFGDEKAERIKNNDPKLKKPILSELGNISPVAVVPYNYSDSELWFQAQNVASMVANNGSFNCNAAKLLVTAKGWKQRDKFCEYVHRALSEAPTRRAYYPGAFDRYEKLTKGRDVLKFGEKTDENLQWAFIQNVDSSDHNDPLFSTEPFCGILSHTEVDGASAEDFLTNITTFFNDVVWGTLNACIIIHPKLEKTPSVDRVLNKAIVELRYGTIAINHWPALAYGFGTTAWGGHPSSTLDNIQSGLGWVHNTYMLEGIDKCVVRGNLVVRPKPLWFYDNYKAAKVCPALLKMEANPGWGKLPGIFAKVLF